ncbi:ABC transporter ATP-binding protein [Haloglycomyces albus]|uniref:ABC transporter ATP-binding protein n=1 Tax=Haloglycomyces albus TaxID=526067 RepID=UPI00046D534A|nr:ABC transporter ATP-binding protein [Haloglycomyces albus]
MIVVDEITKTYQGHVRALDGVSLAVSEGEFTAVVGPSGSGKSTMLNMLGTLDRPDEGTVRIRGLDVAKLDDRALSALREQWIGFVFQSFHLSPRLTALDNVATGLLYSGRRRPDRRGLAAEALDRVGLVDRKGYLPHELSGGQRQRVAIARAAVARPPLLLADEPTGNLDSASGEGVVELLHNLNAAGTAVVVITHDPDLADRLPRQVRMRDGRIVADSAATAETTVGRGVDV